MKTKRMIDSQRILNIITAAKFVSYAPIDRLTDNQHLSGGAMTDKIRISALNYLIDNIRFEFFKNIKINYCPMCGRKLIVAERRKTKMKEKYLTKQDLVNELKKRDREGKKFALRFEVSMLQNKINRLQETLENNKSYLDFIDSLKLMVNVDDQKIPVNHKTVCFYEENQSLIEARMQILQRQLTAKKQELDEL